MLTYWIRIPGRLYDALLDRDAFTSESESSELAALKAARPRRTGSGTSWIIESDDRKTLEDVLNYIESLSSAVQLGALRSAELGVSLSTLRSVANQPLSAY